jgi:hypothetical protein
MTLNFHCYLLFYCCLIRIGDYGIVLLRRCALDVMLLVVGIVLVVLLLSIGTTNTCWWLAPSSDDA